MENWAPQLTAEVVNIMMQIWGFEGMMKKIRPSLNSWKKWAVLKCYNELFYRDKLINDCLTLRHFVPRHSQVTAALPVGKQGTNILNIVQKIKRMKLKCTDFFL